MCLRMLWPQKASCCYIVLDCACRCSGVKNAGLCADPVMTNKQCVIDIFFSFIDGITNRRFMYISYIVLHCACRCSGAIKVGLCADPVMTYNVCLSFFLFIDGITNRRYMYISCIYLHCASRCPGTKNV